MKETLVLRLGLFLVSSTSLWVFSGIGSTETPWHVALTLEQSHLTCHMMNGKLNEHNKVLQIKSGT